MIALVEFVVVFVYAAIGGVLARRVTRHLIDDRNPLSTLTDTVHSDRLTEKGRELREKAIRFYRRGGLSVVVCIAFLEMVRRLAP
jgi:hypothetical protein